MHPTLPTGLGRNHPAMSRISPQAPEAKLFGSFLQKRTVFLMIRMLP
jgi:hypothetical protein